VKSATWDLLRILQEVFTRLDRIHLPLGGELTDLALIQAGGSVPDQDAESGEMDLVFEAGSWQKFDNVVGELEGAGLRRTDRRGVLLGPGGQELFLWPFGSGVAPGDRLQWKDSGAEFSTAGLDLILAQSLPAPVEPGLDVLVPSLPLLVYGRIVFYLGRMAARDLREMVRILDAAPKVDPDIPGARRLGAELRNEIPAPYLQGVRVFLSEIEAVHAPMISHLFRERGAVVPAEGQRLEKMFALFRELRDGIGLP
jgi:hypothetical protein